MNIDRILSNIIQRDKTRNIAHNTNFFPQSFSQLVMPKDKNSIRPNLLMRQRINKLPIYSYVGKPQDVKSGMFLTVKVKDRPDITTQAQLDADKALIDEENGKYFEVKTSLTNNKNLLPITSPKFKSTPAGRMFYRVAKRTPHILTDIEQSGANIVMIPHNYKENINKKSKSDYSGFFLAPFPPHRPQPIIEIFTGDKKAMKHPARVLFHELKHTQQYAQNPKQYEIDMANYDKYQEEEKDPDLSPREMEGYSRMPMEEEAERYAIDKAKQVRPGYGMPFMKDLIDIEYRESAKIIPEYRDYLAEQSKVLPTDKEAEELELQRQGKAMRYIFDKGSKDNKILDIAQQKGITYQGTEEEQRQLKRELKNEPELLNVIQPKTPLTITNIKSYKTEAAKIEKPKIEDAMIPLMVEDKYNEKLAKQSYATNQFLRKNPGYYYNDRTSINNISLKFGYYGLGEGKKATDLLRVREAASQVPNLVMKPSSGRLILPYNQVQYLMERYRRGELTPREQKTFLEYAKRGFEPSEHDIRMYGTKPLFSKATKRWSTQFASAQLPVIQRPDKNEWENYVRKNPHMIADMPNDYLSFNFAREMVKKDPTIIDVIPDEFLTQSIVNGAVRQMYQKRNDKNRRYELRSYPKKFLTPQVVKMLSASSNVNLPGNLNLRPGWPKQFKNKPIMNNLIKYHNLQLQQIPREYRTKELSIESVKQHGDNIRWVPKEYITNELAIAAVKSSPYAVTYLPPEYLTDDLVLDAFKHGTSMGVMPSSYTQNISRDMVSKYIDIAKEDSSLGSLPPRILSDKALIDKALSFGVQFNHIPRQFLSPDLVSKHIRNNKQNVFQLREDQYTPELAEYAASQGVPFSAIPRTMIDDSIIEKYMNKNPLNYKFIPGTKFTNDMKEKILMKDSYDKQYIPPNFSPSPEEIAKYAYKGALQADLNPKINTLPNNYNLANLALYGKKIGKLNTGVDYNDISKTKLKDKPEVKQFLNEQRGRPFTLDDINKYGEKISDSQGINYSTETIVKPWGNWPIGFPESTQLTFLLNIPKNQTSKLRLDNQKLDVYNKAPHPRSFDNNKVTLGWVRAIRESPNNVRVLEIQSDVDNLGYPKTQLIDVERRNLVEFIKNIKNNTDYKKIILAPYHGPGFLPEVYRYMPQRLGFKENKEGWYELDLSKDNRTLYSDIISNNLSKTSKIINTAAPSEVSSEAINKLYQQYYGKKKKPVYINEDDFNKEMLENEEQPEFTKEEKQSVLEDYKKAVREMTPAEIEERLKQEQDAYKNMSPQERTAVLGPNLALMKQLTENEKLFLLGVNMEAEAKIDAYKQRKIQALINKRQKMKEYLKEHIKGEKNDVL